MVNKTAKKFWAFSFYFVFFAGGAALFPFTILFYKSLNLTGAQIGLLTAIPPLITMIASPILTGLADSRQMHRAVMSISIILVASIVFLIPQLSKLAWLAPAIFFYAFFSAPMIPLADNGTVTMLAEESDRYGRLRMGGTIGWGIFAPAMGMLIKSYGIQWAFYGFSIAMVVNLVVAQFMVLKGTAPRHGSLNPGMRILLSDQRWQLFLGMALVSGIILAVSNNYMSLLMQEVGGDTSQMGIALTISTVSELPVLFFSYLLLQRFKAGGILILAIGVASLRSILLSLVGAPIGIYLVQLTQGFTFPIIFVAGVSYANENAPEGMGATAQGLFSAMLMGIGAATGGLLGGILIGQVGVQSTFAIVGIFGLSCLGIYALFNFKR